MSSKRIINKKDNFLDVNFSTKETSVIKLKEHLKKGHCFIFLHMKQCPYTIPFYPIWKDVKTELCKTSNLTLIEVCSDVVGYIRENHTDVYDKLTSFYDEENANKIYFPTFLFFKDGKQHKLMNRVDARDNNNRKEAYEQLLSYAFLCHYRKDDIEKKSNKTMRTKSQKKTFQYQISDALNKLLI